MYAPDEDNALQPALAGLACTLATGHGRKPGVLCERGPALRRYPRLQAAAVAAPAKRAATQAIHVDVNDRELTLRGMVRSFAEYRQAERTAWNAAGVTSVQNKLVIAS